MKILPRVKNIIRVGTVGYLKSHGGSYTAFAADGRRLGDAVNFQAAVELAKGGAK